MVARLAERPLKRLEAEVFPWRERGRKREREKEGEMKRMKRRLEELLRQDDMRCVVMLASYRLAD